MRPTIVAIAIAAVACGGAGRVLRVGPGQPFAVPSAAMAAAGDGDTVRIDSAGRYENDVALIDRDGLTIEGVGPTRAVVHTDGRVYGRKGIWVFAAGRHDLTVRNVDLSGARVAAADGGNGAAVRAEGAGITLLNCRLHDCQDGLLTGAGRGTVTVEHCELDHNGPDGLTHNVYVGDVDAFVFRFNDSHDAAVGHLLKSRAKVNWIEYNRLDDGGGAASYEVDLPDGGRAAVVGNLIVQTARTGNPTVLAYGEEHDARPGELDVVGNTFVNARPGATFIAADRLPAGFRLVARNNLFVGPGTAVRIDRGTPTVGGNVAIATESSGDHRPAHGSPAAGAAVPAGVDWAGEPLTPAFEPGPAFALRRSAADAGAFATR